MEDKELGKYTRSFGLSVAITSVLSALLVVLKETNEHTVLAWMKSATGHHWMTHGVLDIIIFVALGLLLALADGGRGVQISSKGLVNAIFGAVVVGGLIIAGFYLMAG